MQVTSVWCSLRFVLFVFYFQILWMCAESLPPLLDLYAVVIALFGHLVWSDDFNAESGTLFLVAQNVN